MFDQKINPASLSFPSEPECPIAELTGMFPVDFIIDTLIQEGLQWFRDTSEAPNQVFGQLLAPWLATKYGQKKIDEIAAYIRKFEIKVVHHWSLIATNSPCYSIQLLEGVEEESRAGLDDHLRMVDIKNEMNEQVLGRTQLGYAPIIDNLHIGIHNEETPDLTKYLYYLLTYILTAFKPVLQERGLQLTTFRATDISRLNEYLPENMYSRFVNFTAFTIAPFERTKLPIIDKILGLAVSQESSEVLDSASDEGVSELEIETGIKVCDIKQGE